MTLEDFENAFVLYLSGVEKLFKNEIKYESEIRGTVFIEFPTMSPNYVIVREYRNNKRKHKRFEEIYINGKLFKLTAWHYNGRKYMEREFLDGKLHGKDLGWWENGNKEWENIYENGEIKENKRWNMDGVEIK